jgi:hypothetical protein
MWLLDGRIKNSSPNALLYAACGLLVRQIVSEYAQSNVFPHKIMIPEILRKIFEHGIYFYSRFYPRSGSHAVNHMCTMTRPLWDKNMLTNSFLAKYNAFVIPNKHYKAKHVFQYVTQTISGEGRLDQVKVHVML